MIIIIITNNNFDSSETFDRHRIYIITTNNHRERERMQRQGEVRTGEVAKRMRVRNKRLDRVGVVGGGGVVLNAGARDVATPSTVSSPTWSLGVMRNEDGMSQSVVEDDDRMSVRTNITMSSAVYDSDSRRREMKEDDRKEEDIRVGNQKRSNKKKDKDDYKPNTSHLTFYEWMLFKKMTSKRPRFLLSKDEYDVLMRVVLNDVVGLKREDLKWTRELLRKMTLKVVKKLDEDSGISIDTLVHPSFDEHSLPIQIIVAHVEKIEKIICKHHVLFTGHAGINATYDSL
jgi:hypothetical protein